MLRHPATPLLLLALLLLYASAIDSAVHISVRQSSSTDPHKHHHHPEATEAASTAAAMAATMTAAPPAATATAANNKTSSATATITSRPDLVAAVKFVECPTLRTLANSCADVKHGGRFFACVVGGRWREVDALPEDDLDVLLDAYYGQPMCTNAFYGSTWTDTSADASGLRIETVQSLKREWVTLNLSNNLLTDFDLSAALTSDLSGNQIESFASIVPPVDLVSLTVGGYPLTTLELTSKAHSTLKVLDASNASLVSVLANTSTTLQALRVPFNNLSTFDNISLPETLYSLDLSFNQLTNWTKFTPPRTLGILLASDNGITKLPQFNFTKQVDKLIAVDFSFNNIQSIGGIFWHPSLTHIDFRNNPITKFEIQRSDLGIFQNLVEFRISLVESEACSKGTLEAVGKNNEIKICVLEDTVFLAEYGYPAPTSSSSHGVLIGVTVASCFALLVLALFLLRRFIHQKHKFNIELTRDAVLCDASWIEDDQALAALRIEVSDLKIEKTIAKRNLAVVYLARMVDQRVAVKKIRLDKAKDAHAFTGLLEEIRLRSKLEHPKVVKFVGYCWAQVADLALVTEFMDNGNLSTLLKKQYQQQQQASKLMSCLSLSSSSSSSSSEQWAWYNGTAELPAKVLFAIDIAEALVYLHTLAEPIVHGDIQSQNVLLSHDWVAKLAGFGSKEERPQVSELLTTAAPGAVAWTAPEILKHEAHDVKADVYAFGVLVAELDACANPYADSGLTNAQIALAVTDGELKPAFRPDCPAEIVEMATACLSFNAADRPAAMKLHYDVQLMVRASLVHM